MGKETNKTQTIDINGVTHNLDDLSPEQVELVKHVLSLDNKIQNAQFTMTELQGGRAFFMGQLEASLDDGLEDVSAPNGVVMDSAEAA